MAHIPPPSLLVVDHTPDLAEMLRRTPCCESMKVEAATWDSALEAAACEEFSVALLVERQPGLAAAQLLLRIRSTWPNTQVLTVAAYPDISSVADVLGAGESYGPLVLPWDHEDLAFLIEAATREHARQSAQPADEEGVPEEGVPVQFARVLRRKDGGLVRIDTTARMRPDGRMEGQVHRLSYTRQGTMSAHHMFHEYVGELRSG